ncbi:MAG TPA: polyprenyl synthetase family protein [Streptosporangiaceae bacterium]|nr:polyprenyl synthetase family protein [Streptosporangiaceae bacterium]
MSISATLTRPHRTVAERVDATLRAFLDDQVHRYPHAELPAVLGVVERFVLGGGKRMRPQFCYWGWRGAGGDDGQAIIEVGASLELLHAFALIHDDIMDASDTRRGRPTVHRSLARLHERNGWSGDAGRFGVSTALLCGDLCSFWSDEMLHGCGLPAARLAAVRPLLNAMRTELCAGQYFDLAEQASGGTLEGALRVIRYKTGCYTVERPLQAGAALAGAGPGLQRAYSAYGVPIGEAFQLRDDILGVFGDPALTGKPVLDDLRDGKATVLMALTRRSADTAQLALIDRWHGNPALDEDGAAALRQTIVATGALDQVQDMIEQRTSAALTALDQADIDSDARIALRDLGLRATRRQV